MTHTSTEQSEVNELCQWFDEADGFTQGTAAPHKWVLQAYSEINRLHARVQELEAAQAQRAPLTDAQIEGLLIDWPKDGIAFFDFARAIERAHGITQEKQP